MVSDQVSSSKGTALALQNTEGTGVLQTTLCKPESKTKIYLVLNFKNTFSIVPHVKANMSYFSMLKR